MSKTRGSDCSSVKAAAETKWNSDEVEQYCWAFEYNWTLPGDGFRYTVCLPSWKALSHTSLRGEGCTDLLYIELELPEGAVAGVEARPVGIGDHVGREPAFAHPDDNHRSNTWNIYGFGVGVRKSWLNAALDDVFDSPKLSLNACDAEGLYLTGNSRGVAVLITLVGDAEDDVAAGGVCKRRDVCEKLRLLIQRVNGQLLFVLKPLAL